MNQAPVSFMKLMDLTAKRDTYLYSYLFARRYETLDELECKRVVAFALEYIRRGPKWREQITNVLNWYYSAFEAVLKQRGETIPTNLQAEMDAIVLPVSQKETHAETKQDRASDEGIQERKTPLLQRVQSDQQEPGGGDRDVGAAPVQPEEPETCEVA